MFSTSGTERSVKETSQDFTIHVSPIIHLVFIRNCYQHWVEENMMGRCEHCKWSKLTYFDLDDKIHVLQAMEHSEPYLIVITCLTEMTIK